jgi:putative DNA primase/helicase
MSSATDRDTGLLRFYANEGIKLVRLSHGTKKPVDTEWQQRPLAVEDAEEWVRGGGDVGWQCGEVSGWVSAIDLDCDEARRLAPRFLPETLRGAKGKETPSQYFYRSTELGYKKFSELGGPAELISLKASNNGRGHQVAVAPSIHREKGPYHFVGGYNPAAVAVVDKDKLRHLVGMLAAAALLARQLPPSKDEGGGGRHDLALALAGYMLRNGEAVEDVEEMLVAAWEYRKAPSEALEDVRLVVRDTAATLARNEPATGGRRLGELIPRMPEKIADFLGWDAPNMREQRQSYMRTDLGNAERFVAAYQGRVRWCPARKSWLVWGGQRYVWDDRGENVKMAHHAARGIFHEAAHAKDEDEQKAIAKWAVSSQSESRINAMLSQAKPYLAVGMEELDRDPWLINCQNGTLDLRTGRLKDHDPADLITRIAPVEYDPEATCPRFERFLHETLVDDEVIRFVKRYAGYTLTGITRERIMAILYGSGKNGKTTLVELLHEALGDYARNTDVETLLIRKYAGVGNDVAALKGARFVSAAEVEKGRRLAESKLKQLTGRDTVTARFLFGENFDFKPEFKLWLSTNNKPVIQGTDDAIWDRLRLIPFTQRFDGAKADPLLSDKLRDELAGVFAWMVEGCLQWQEHGLGEPESVTEATQQYREDMDTLAAFFEDRCVLGERLMTPASRLYKTYQLWCDEAGEHAETQKMFGMRLSERGFVSEKITRGSHKDRKGWLGIGLRADDPEPEDPDDGDNAKLCGASGTGDGPLSGHTAEDHPPGEKGAFAGKTPDRNSTEDDSGPKNQQLPHGYPRVGEVVEKRSASSASSAGEPRDEVAELFADPPEWLRKQAALCRADPSERMLRPLCSSAAAELYNDPRRGEEIRVQVENELGRWDR